MYWCKYHEVNLKIEDSDAVIATGDPYLTKLAKRYGFKTMSTLDVLRQMGVKNPEEQLKNMEHMPIPKRELCKFVHNLIEDGITQIMPSNIDKAKVGKTLFGDGIKN